MADTREKLSHVTITLHWIIGLTIIGPIAVGLYMSDLPRGEWKFFLYGWHKVIGTTVLMFAAVRLLWRWRNGLPLPLGKFPEWQHKLVNGVHVVLLMATVLMPLSGATLSYFHGHPIPVLGLFNIDPPAEKIDWIGDAGGFVHCWAGWAGWALVGIISLHVLGALKHHAVDKDGTLRRMLGARIN
jgi:cytochrome b561